METNKLTNTNFSQPKESGFMNYISSFTYSFLLLAGFSSLILASLIYINLDYDFLNESLFWTNLVIIGWGALILVLSLVIFYKNMQLVQKNHQLVYQSKNLESENRSLKQQMTFLRMRAETEAPFKTLVLGSKAVLNVDDIVYIASDGPYLEYYLFSKSKPEMDRQTLKAALQKLPTGQFLQIHRSHIINIQYVRILKANEVVLEDGTTLRISRTYKDSIQILKDSYAPFLNIKSS